jgi:hypothetical protein
MGVRQLDHVFCNCRQMLYCALTGQLMEKSLAAVKKHMVGKRFVRAKERYMLDEVELRPEMDLSPPSDEVSLNICKCV